MSNTTYKFWCLVEGEKTPFPIIASSSVFIAKLKQLIKKEKCDTFQMVDASDITFWKVNVDFDAVEDKIMCGEFRPDVNDQLQPLQTLKVITSQLFEVWPEPPPNHGLHVFVNRPSVVTPTIRIGSVPVIPPPYISQRPRAFRSLDAVGPLTCSALDRVLSSRPITSACQ